MEIFMIIKNGLVFTDKFRFEKKDIYIGGGYFVGSEKEADGDEVVDASGFRVIPGLVDVHTHASFGHTDFSANLTKAAAELYVL